MTRNTRVLLPLCTLLAATTLGACQREAQPAAEVAPAATTAPATPATVVPAAPVTAAPAAVAESAAPGEHTAFDAKAFAGTFTAPGASITFDADGGYTMRVRAESAGADLDTQGTWTLEPDARHILLDPSSKSDPDRRFELASMDELRPTDGGTALRREGAH